MKSELKIVEVENQPKFPALYIKEGSNLVMLFTSSTSGTVVSAGLGWKVGESRNCWNEAGTCGWQRLPSGSQVILTQD